MYDAIIATTCAKNEIVVWSRVKNIDGIPVAIFTKRNNAPRKKFCSLRILGQRLLDTLESQGHTMHSLEDGK